MNNTVESGNRPEGLKSVKQGNFMDVDGNNSEKDSSRERMPALVDSPIVKGAGVLDSDGRANGLPEDEADDIAQSIATISTAFTSQNAT